MRPSIERVHVLPLARGMAIARATKALVFLALLGSLSAVFAAKALGRLSERHIVAPEAWQALDQHEAARAAALFNEALKQHPDDAMLHFGKASAAYALGKPAAASSALGRALDLDPQFAEALALRAQMAYERGDADLAIRSMEQAVALRPHDAGLADLLEHWRREATVHGSFVEQSARHFRILYEGGTDQNIGDRVASVLEREYPRIGRALNTYPQDSLTVILYTNREFHDITRSPSWATGAYDGRIRVAVGGALASPRELDRIVTHELVHAFVASAAPRRVPAWLNEGLACYLETSDAAWATDALRRASSTVPLDDLVSGFRGLDEQAALVAYAESAIAAEILSAELGPNLGGFLQSVGRGDSVDQSLLHFQIQPNAFHSEWRRRVEVR